MSKDQAPRDGLWLLVDKLQEDLESLENKVDDTSTTVTELNTLLPILSASLEKVNTTLLGVSNDGLLFKVQQIQTDVTDVSKDVKQLKIEINKLVNSKDPRQLKLARWRTIGKVAGFLALVGPGFLAFIHTFFN